MTFLPLLLSALFLAPLAGVTFPTPGFVAVAFVVRLVAATAFPMAVAAGWGRWRGIFKHPLSLAVIAVFLVFFAAAVFAEDPNRALWGEALRSEGMVQAAAWLLLFFSAAVAFRDRERLVVFLRCAVVSALAIGAAAVVEEVIRWLVSSDAAFNYRVYGLLENPIFFGNVMALSAIAACWLSRIERGRMRRLAAAAAAALLVVALASGSRSVPFGLAGGATAALLLRLSLARHWPIARRIARGTAAAVLGMAAALALLAAASPLFFSHYQFSPGDSGVAERVTVWRNDWPYILERPVLGWGPENQLVVFYRWFTADFSSSTTDVFDRAHNVVVETLLSAGMLGLAAVLALVASLAWTVRRVARAVPEQRGAMLAAAALLGYAACADQFAFETLFSLSLLVPLAGALVPIETPAGAQPSSAGRARPAAVAAAAAACAAFLVFMVLLPVWGSWRATAAMRRYAEDLPGSTASFGAATARPSYANDPLAKRFAGLVTQEIVTRQVRDPELVLAAARLAESRLLRAEAEHPWDPTLKLTRALLLEQAGKLDPAYLDDAEPVLDALIARYPERFEARQLLALVYLRQERIAEALQQYEIMLAKNDRLAPLHELYAITLYRAGRTPEALAQLDIALELNPTLAPRIANIRERILAGVPFDPALAPSAAGATSQLDR